MTRFSTGPLENLEENFLEKQGFAQFPQSFPQVEGGNLAEQCRTMWKKLPVQFAQKTCEKTVEKWRGNVENSIFHTP